LSTQLQLTIYHMITVLLPPVSTQLQLTIHHIITALIST